MISFRPLIGPPHFFIRYVFSMLGFNKVLKKFILHKKCHNQNNSTSLSSVCVLCDFSEILLLELQGLFLLLSSFCILFFSSALVVLSFITSLLIISMSRMFTFALSSLFNVFKLLNHFFVICNVKLNDLVGFFMVV